MVLNTGLLEWEYSTLTTRPLMLTPSFPKCWIEKKRTIQYLVCICRCSLPRFQYKVTVLFHLKLKEFPCQKVVNTAGGIFFTGWCEPEEE